MPSQAAPLDLSMPRSTHQKFVPYFLFPILIPRLLPLSSLSIPSAISYPCLIVVYTKNYALRSLRGSIAAYLCLPLAILSYPLTSHCAYLTWIISECGHPSKFLLEQVFLIHYYPVKEISVFPTTSTQCYIPEARIIDSFVHTTSRHS